VLKERLPKEVRLNGTCSSGADDDRNDRVLLRVVMSRLTSGQWRNDRLAAASTDGGPTGGRGPPTVLEFLVINFSVCLVLLSNRYIIIHCIVWFQVQPLIS